MQVQLFGMSVKPYYINKAYTGFGLKVTMHMTFGWETWSVITNIRILKLIVPNSPRKGKVNLSSASTKSYNLKHFNSFIVFVF